MKCIYEIIFGEGDVGKLVAIATLRLTLKNALLIKRVQ